MLSFYNSMCAAKKFCPAQIFIMFYVKLIPNVSLLVSGQLQSIFQQQLREIIITQKLNLFEMGWKTHRPWTRYIPLMRIPVLCTVGFLKPQSVLHSRFPTKKSWVVAYFFNFFNFKKKFYLILLKV